MIQLLQEMHRYLTTISGPCLSPYLADWPTGDRPMRKAETSPLPVLSFLPGMSAMTAAAAVPMVKSLEQSASGLCWRQSYSEEDLGAEFLSKYGLTELVGPLGVLESDRLVCGFLLLGPGVEYPKHRHEAEEVYIPLSPGILWASGGERWVYRPVGLPLHHPPWTVHAMKTGRRPLLALYLWRGKGISRRPRLD